MYNIEYFSEQVYNNLAMHRFHVHKDEISRVLKPVLDEVYRYGFERGIADSCNNIFVTEVGPAEEVAPEWSGPVGNIEAHVEVIHHEPQHVITYQEYSGTEDAQ